MLPIVSSLVLLHWLTDRYLQLHMTKKNAAQIRLVQQAEKVFAERLDRFRSLPWLDQSLPTWRTRFMRSQWGSCSHDGVIALNTHLVKTPERVIDYVILHELCHLVHHDHSRRFYSLMSKHMPDWQDRSSELDGFMPVLLHE